MFSDYLYPLNKGSFYGTNQFITLIFFCQASPDTLYFILYTLYLDNDHFI
jgi:hypothetical protein